MDHRRAFENMHPGFFDEPGIRNLPAESIFAELIMDLRRSKPSPAPYPCPADIVFGMYRGEPSGIRDTVGLVDEEWIRYFGGRNRVFCAFYGGTIASFCILEDWGLQEGLRIGGPGCVGTVPAYRGMGIGLELVRRATVILADEGFDISWIHYTGLRHWYEKLGYQTILRWNSKGILPE